MSMDQPGSAPAGSEVTDSNPFYSELEANLRQLAKEFEHSQFIQLSSSAEVQDSANGNKEDTTIARFQHGVASLLASPDPTTADLVSMPVWKLLKAISEWGRPTSADAAVQLRRVRHLLRTSTMCPLLRSTRCFTQPGQPLEFLFQDTTKSFYAAETLHASLSTISDRLSSEQLAAWRELTASAKLLASLGKLNERLNDPTALKQFLADRDANVEKLVKQLNTFQLLSVSTDIALGKDGAGFAAAQSKINSWAKAGNLVFLYSPAALAGNGQGDEALNQPQPQPQLKHCAPLDFLLQVVVMYATSLLLAPLASTIPEPFAKLRRTVKDMERRSVKFGTLSPSANGSLASATGVISFYFDALLVERRGALASAYSTAATWKTSVNESIVEAVLGPLTTTPVQGVKKGPLPSRVAELTRQVRQQQSKVQPRWEQLKVGSSTSVGNKVDENENSDDSAADGSSRLAPFLEDWRSLHDTFANTVPNEVAFSDDGSSNSLRDLDLVVGNLRAISRAPILNAAADSGEGQGGSDKGISLAFLRDILHHREFNAGEKLNGTGATGRKRTREPEEPLVEDGSSDVGTHGGERDPRRQTRVILPVPADFEGRYKTIGHRPPLEASWSRYYGSSE
jgi:hypothetical protein